MFRFMGILLQDIEQYTLAMDVVLNILDNYYEKYSLESNAVVWKEIFKISNGQEKVKLEWGTRQIGRSLCSSLLYYI